jgi:hypothetical protein
LTLTASITPSSLFASIASRSAGRSIAWECRLLTITSPAPPPASPLMRASTPPASITIGWAAP